MHNRILKSAWLLAVCLPTLALAQDERGKGTWEWSAGGGVKIMDSGLRDFLASGAATQRFTSSTDPGRIAPGITLRVAYSFSNRFAFSVGGEGASGDGVTYLSPLTAITFTPKLNARTSPFISVGSQNTRIYGSNGRRTHPTWGAHVGAGVRQMFKPHMAFKLELRMASEHYAELPGKKAAYPGFATIGFSYFRGGPLSDAQTAR